MHRHIDGTVQKRGVQGAGEDALAADAGERRIRQLVTPGSDGVQRDARFCARRERGRHLPALNQGKRGPPGPQPQVGRPRSELRATCRHPKTGVRTPAG